jgi:hypothetical protein
VAVDFITRLLNEFNLNTTASMTTTLNAVQREMCNWNLPTHFSQVIHALRPDTLVRAFGTSIVPMLYWRPNQDIRGMLLFWDKLCAPGPSSPVVKFYAILVHDLIDGLINL